MRRDVVVSGAAKQVIDNENIPTETAADIALKKEYVRFDACRKLFYHCSS